MGVRHAGPEGAALGPSVEKDDAPPQRRRGPETGAEALGARGGREGRRPRFPSTARRRGPRSSGGRPWARATSAPRPTGREKGGRRLSDGEAQGQGRRLWGRAEEVRSTPRPSQAGGTRRRSAPRRLPAPVPRDRGPDRRRLPSASGPPARRRAAGGTPCSSGRSGFSSIC